MESDTEGRLVMRSGSDLLWDSVESILDTQEGTCPLDPKYGMGPAAYDNVASVNAFCHRIGEAIARSEPRVTAIDVTALGVNKDTNTLRIRITLTPIATQVPENRILSVFGLP